MEISQDMSRKLMIGGFKQQIFHKLFGDKNIRVKNDKMFIIEDEKIIREYDIDLKHLAITVPTEDGIEWVWYEDSNVEEINIMRNILKMELGLDILYIQNQLIIECIKAIAIVDCCMDMVFISFNRYDDIAHHVGIRILDDEYHETVKSLTDYNMSIGMSEEVIKQLRMMPQKIHDV